jgi:PleD family two-component response regulator
MTEQMNNLLSSETGKILIVEDELLVALDIRRILEKRGFSIVGIADTGESAVLISGGFRLTWCSWNHASGMWTVRSCAAYRRF